MKEKSNNGNEEEVENRPTDRFGKNKAPADEDGKKNDHLRESDQTDGFQLMWGSLSTET